MIEVISSKDQRILAYSNLKKPLADSPYFIAENEKVVRRLLQSRLRIESIFGTKEAVLRNLEFIEENGISMDNVFVSSKDILEEIVGFTIHRGIMAQGSIPDNLSLDKIQLPCIILNRIYDSENIGSILRTASAFGIKDIIYDRESSHPYLRRSVRVSMGNIFEMRIHHSESLHQTIFHMQKENVAILGASANSSDSRTISLYDFSFPKRWVLILGNEAEGIAESIERICQTLIHIPMDLLVDSLNVSHSLASILSVWKSRN